MLKVPQLNDMTYEQIIQRAVSRIPSLTDQWTDFNSHDPGITVLQTYAWLVDMLNYYMDATGDVHVKKYLKLLGIQQQKRGTAITATSTGWSRSVSRTPSHGWTSGSGIFWHCGFVREKRKWRSPRRLVFHRRR